MHQDQQWWVEFGRALQKIQHTADGLEEVRHDLVEIKALLRRGALLAALWGGVLILALSNDKAAEIIVKLLAARGA